MKIHMVKKGDTLYLLSQKYNVALDKLIAANPHIANPDKLDIGMKVKIPAEPVTPKPEGVLHSHKVQQGDSLWKLSQAWGVPLKDMIQANPQLKNPNALLVGEIVYIPSMKSSEGTTSNASVGNVVGHEKLSPEGKEYTGVKEEVIQPALVVPTPPPVAENLAPAPAPAPIMPNVTLELEVVPQLPKAPEVKPEKEMPKKQESKTDVNMKSVNESPKNKVPNLAPEIMPEVNPVPPVPEYMIPVDVAPATKSPCGCGSKLMHAPAEHPYAPIPVPVQEVYTVQQSTYIAGTSNNSPFPGVMPIAPYAGGEVANSPWTAVEPINNHNNVMPNVMPSVAGEKANSPFPVSPAGQVNSPFPTYASPNQMNQQPPMISPYSMLPYPPCNCGSHSHSPTYPAYGYQDPAWNMYGSSYGMPHEISTSAMPHQPIEYAYQNPYPTQNMVPPSPLGAFGEMYPPQNHDKGSNKKSGREDANFSDVTTGGIGVDSGTEAKQVSDKSATLKRRTTKAPLKNKSKARVSGKTGIEKASSSSQRKKTNKRRNPWIQK